VRGPARHLSSAELDELARITPEDVERARQTWEAIASPMVRALLDAVPVDDLGEVSQRRVSGELEIS
jgi:hypothetical protein